MFKKSSARAANMRQRFLNHYRSKKKESILQWKFQRIVLLERNFSCFCIHVISDGHLNNATFILTFLFSFHCVCWRLVSKLDSDISNQCSFISKRKKNSLANLQKQANSMVWWRALIYIVISIKLIKAEKCIDPVWKVSEWIGENSGVGSNCIWDREWLRRKIVGVASDLCVFMYMCICLSLTFTLTPERLLYRYRNHFHAHQANL